jgi:beta-phosphoglucomutase-like phosphatase (HAD superfamily)
MSEFQSTAAQTTTPLPDIAKTMGGKKLVLLDFDGTLVDGAETGAMKVAQDEIQTYLDELRSQDPDREDVRLSIEDFHGLTGKTTEAVVQEIIDRKNLGLSDDQKATLIARVHQARKNEIPGKDVKEIDGTKIYLQYLKNNNIPFAIVTNSETKRVVNFLGKAGLLDYFDNGQGGHHIVSAHDNCGDKGKPGPEPYLKALEIYGKGIDKKHVAVIEDSVPGVTAARAAGIEAVMGITASEAIKDKDKRAAELTGVGAARVFRSYYDIMSAHTEDYDHASPPPVLTPQDSVPVLAAHRPRMFGWLLPKSYL